MASVFGGAIDGAALAADMAHLRRDGHDGAFDARCHHAARDIAGHEIGGTDIQTHHGIEIIRLDLDHRLGPVGSGIVDQHIERTSRFDHGFGGGQIGHIHHQRLGLQTLGAKGFGSGLDLVAAARRQHHMCARFRQSDRSGQPDATTGTGHQSLAAIEPEGGGFRQPAH